MATSLVAAYALAEIYPSVTGVLDVLTRFVLIAAASTVVLVLTEQLARRLLPLAALLDLSLLFPDHAPSRFRVAIRNGTTSQLKKRLAELDSHRDEAMVDMAERLLGLVAALSIHDRLTRGHSERVRAYAQMIATELGMSEHELDKLRWSALLHDIGKLRIDPAILNKPGKLTTAEYEIVKQHPTIGFALTTPLASWLGDSVRAVAEHHERWDGRGYPRGLAGNEISYAARIVSVADAFDVMTSVRSYKPPQSAAAARAELARCAGTQFDPMVVRAFLGVSLGKLWFRLGPLSWLAQASLIPRSLATGLNARLAALAAVTGAAIVGTGILPDLPTYRPTVANAAAADASSPESFGPPTTTGSDSDSGAATTTTVTVPPTAPPPTQSEPPPQQPTQPPTSGPPGSPPGTQPPTPTIPTVEIPTAVTIPPITVPPITVPPITVPPITVPPITVPPITVPPITVPTVTVPIVTVPPITIPTVTVPPITVPPITVPPLPPLPPIPKLS